MRLNLFKKTQIVASSLPFILIICCKLYAQDDLLEMIQKNQNLDSKIEGSFNTHYLVNTETNEMLDKKDVLIEIAHRFSTVGGPSGGIKNAYGTDFVNDIRLSLSYGISNRITLGIARSKLNNRVDGKIKVLLMQQTAKKVPFSVAFLANAGLAAEFDSKSNPNTVVDPNSPGELIVKYPQYLSRLNYLYQLPIARKFGSKFSIVITPTVLYRNYVLYSSESNLTYAAGIGAKLKISPKSYLIADYFYNFSTIQQPYYNPIGVGYEVSVGGHTFQITASNNGGILPNQFLVQNGDSWLKNQGFHIGFNIIRSVGIGKKAQAKEQHTLDKKIGSNFGQ